MPAIWTEADLASRGFNPDGSRVARRDPVAGGGVDGAECGSEGVDGPVDLPREATEPNPGGAYAADRRPLAAGGNGSRPVKSRQAGGSPAPRNKFGAIRTEGLGPNGERRGRGRPEEAIQCAMVAYWRPRLLPGARLIALNGELPGGEEQVRRAARRKRMGYWRGTPDLAVLYRGRIGFIEVKHQRALSTEQKEFRDWCEEQDFPWCRARTVEQLGEYLMAWGMVR